MVTSSTMAGSACSSVEYAKDTPVMLGTAVADDDVNESNVREAGPEETLSACFNNFCNFKHQVMQACETN